MRIVFVLAALLLSYCAQAAKLMVVIDDMGNNYSLGKRLVDIPQPLNLAFLPHTPAAAELAEQAFQRGHTVMLHAPMQNVRHANLGKGGLYPEMSKTELQATLQDDLNSIPHVQGINNHMGSLLTAQADAMQWVMEVLKARGLFFLDSRTTALTVAQEEAEAAGLFNTRRHVFLDNNKATQALQTQLNTAVKYAKKQGYAILIGHPYPETVQFLEHALGNMAQQNIELIGLNEFFKAQLWQHFPKSEVPHSRYELAQ